MDSARAIPLFCKAIDAELAAVRSNGGRQIRLRDRQGLGSDGRGSFYYAFRSDAEVALPDDSPIEVQAAGETIRGVIVRVDGFRLTLAMESPLPGSKEYWLVTNPTFLLEGLKRALKEVETSQARFNVDLAERLLRQTDTGLDKRLQNELPPTPDLNSEQREAVTAALSQPLTYIWGPPGTGKTHTLAKLVSFYLTRGLKATGQAFPSFRLGRFEVGTPTY